jgi:filamentous hemagglutinin
VLYAGDSSSSTTHSGISGAAVTITITNTVKQQELTGQTAEQTIAAINTDVSSDRDGSNTLKPIFDAQEIGVDFEIVGKFVQNVSQYIESRAREIDQMKEQAEKEKTASNDKTLSDDVRIKHLENYRALNQQIKEIGDNWGAGGTYRQIATALVAGISGNVAGSSAQFAQNMVVNYVQQQGSAYIGELVKKGLKEGSPEHAALHAILGCAGAAASNQSCSAGALGGSAASVLAGLFADSDPNETAVEREAKRNIITSLVTGIAAMSSPNGAATANNAATANVDNNWLATQQYVQAKKEIDAEPNLVKKLAIAAKWQITSLRQDLLTGSGILKGFTDGMAGAGLGTLDSAVAFMTDPVQSLKAAKEFAYSDEAKALLGEAVVATLKSQIDQIGKAVVEGGDANAENLGNQLGQVVAIVAQLMLGGGTSSANRALKLSEMGIDVSVSTVKKMGASVDINAVKTQITKLEDVLRDTDVPVLDPVIPPKTSGGLAGNGEGLFSNVNRTPYEPKGFTIGQAFDFSCVAASCKMAANLADTPEAYIRQAILMESDGAFLSNVPNGLKDLGFTGTATYSGSITVQTIKTATENGASVIVNVRTELGGLHAIVVDSVENGLAGIRDPWPLGVGSTYSVPVSSLDGILNGGVIVHP